MGSGMTRDEWERWKERNGDWWEPTISLVMLAGLGFILLVLARYVWSILPF